MASTWATAETRQLSRPVNVFAAFGARTPTDGSRETKLHDARIINHPQFNHQHLTFPDPRGRRKMKWNSTVWTNSTWTRLVTHHFCINIFEHIWQDNLKYRFTIYIVLPLKKYLAYRYKCNITWPDVDMMSVVTDGIAATSPLKHINICPAVEYSWSDASLYIILYTALVCFVAFDATLLKPTPHVWMYLSNLNGFICHSTFLLLEVESAKFIFNMIHRIMTPHMLIAHTARLRCFGV